MRSTNAQIQRWPAALALAALSAMPGIGSNRRPRSAERRTYAPHGRARPDAVRAGESSVAMTRAAAAAG